MPISQWEKIKKLLEPNSREILRELVMREIKGRYKQSVLGYFWVLINPTVQMLILTFVFSTIFRTSSWDIPYPLFVFSGLLPWIFFSNSVLSATGSTAGGGSFITKVYFPRELLPIATVIAKIVDLLLASLIFIGMLIYYWHPISLSILWLPLIFFIHLLFTIGLGLAFSAVNLFFRDIQNLVGLLMTLWFYITPILYPPDIIPEPYRTILGYNPLWVITNAYRKVILIGGNPDIYHLMLTFCVALITLIIGYKIHNKLEPYFADNI